jgi:hypothetical protein
VTEAFDKVLINDEMWFDAGHLPAGVYVVRILTSNSVKTVLVLLN